MAKPIKAEEATENAAAAKEGTPGVAAPVAKKKTSLSISSNFLVLIFVVGVFGYLSYASWAAYKSSTVVVAPESTPTPAVPALKLNQDNVREAPPITVDENGIGKDDPFSTE